MMNKLKVELTGNVGCTGTGPNNKYHVYIGFVNKASFQEHLQTVYLSRESNIF